MLDVVSCDDLIAFEFGAGASREAFNVPEKAVARSPHLGCAVIIGLVKTSSEVFGGEGVDLFLVTREVASAVVPDFFDWDVTFRLSFF